MSHLAVPRTTQSLAVTARMVERQFVAEVVFLRFRRVRKQRVFAREVLLVYLMTFGSAYAVRVEGAREPIQDVE